MDALDVAYFRQWIQCPYPVASFLRQRAVFQSPERWVAHINRQRFGGDRRAGLRAAVEAGRIIFDPGFAATCIELLDDPSCEWVNGSTAVERVHACNNALRGVVALGDVCFSHGECGAGAFCEAEQPSCPGVCASQRAPGTPCEDSAVCLVDSGYSGGCEVDEDDEELDEACVVYPVERGAALGDACGKLDNGTLVWCSPGLFCDNDDAGLCRTPIAPGQPCELDWVCEGFDVCDPITNTCQPLTVQTEVGAPCSISEGTLQVCDPTANLVCRDERCVAAPPGILNGPCWRSDFSGFGCQPGLYCDVRADRCLPIKSTGEACVFEQECEVSCDTFLNVCTDHYCQL